MARDNDKTSPVKATQHKHTRSNPFAAILSSSKADAQVSGPTSPSKGPVRKHLPRSQTEHILDGRATSINPHQPLGEIHNLQDRPDRGRAHSKPEPRPKSLHKRTKSALSLKGLAGKIWEDKDHGKEFEDHPLKSLKQAKKSKSSTSLSALLARPKSRGKDTVEARVKDIESKYATKPMSDAPIAPIWAQFASGKPEAEAELDDSSVEAAFEDVLKSRNVPYDVREKMRTMDTKLKAEFIRQHQTNSSKSSGSSKDNVPTSPTKRPRANTGDSKVAEEEGSPKKPRPRSFQLSASKVLQSSGKKQRGHKQEERPKSMELSRSSSSTSLVSQTSKYNLSSLFGGPRQTTPGEFIVYLKKPQPIQTVEVGRLQRLRQLLRNETVEWVDSFIAEGGMEAVVNLLYRIIEMDWRDEHEDSLMHHTLSCLKALATTNRGLEHLSVLQEKLFPKLIKLLFSSGEEKRGPAEFTTRDQIMTLMLAFLRAGPTFSPAERARKILSYLRDPEPAESERPPNFMLAMRRPRPYKVWFGELSNVTKEVFWIFLHAVNVIPYPDVPDINPNDAASYRQTYFPSIHTPVPAAPHVGGIEWEATYYLTTHLDLLNGLMASLPTVAERNTLRVELRDSGFEKAMGASLRTCKQKFYGHVHEALSTYVGAGKVDGWDVRMVREGPTREEREKSRSPAKNNKGKENRPPLLGEIKVDAGPKLQLKVMNPDFGGALL